MKKTVFLFLALFAVSAMAVSPAEAKTHMGKDGGMAMGDSGDDDRSLIAGSPAETAKRLMHMREHLSTVQKVVASLALGDFNGASGITEKGFGHGHGVGKKAGDEAFSGMENAFEESTEELAKTLKSKDMKKSLAALEDTLQICESCHDTFKFR